MKPITLRLRLFAASFTSILIALLIAGIGIASLFSNHVEKTLIKDLTAQFDRLVSLVEPNSSPLTLSAPLADPSFAIPYGGLYWQITDAKTNERIRSRSMWDYEFNIDEKEFINKNFHTISIIDPEGTPSIALVQRLQFDLKDGSSRDLDIIMVEDLNFFYKANKQFRNELASSLLFLAFVLAVAAWIQITLGLAPLSKIKKEVNQITSGYIKRLSEKHPPEVMPLIKEVNDLLETQEKYIEFARTRASNLAHGLKTALSVMSSEAENIKKSGNKKSAKLIEETTNDMQAIIDHQLRLSRLKTRARSEHFKSPLLLNINKIVNTLKLTPKGSEINWHIDIKENFSLDIDTPDLLETFGIILENAVQWSEKNIYIKANIVNNLIQITVEDDGVGIETDKLKLLGKRGLRLDSKGSGSGIGLSIVNEIIAMNNGEISFTQSKKKGLKVTILLPFIS